MRTLPDHTLLDRVVRGRAWIPLLGLMLAGIVAMQVEVLGLGASVGRAIERTTTLQSRNEMLRASVASLSDQQRIERRAAAMGMVMPAPAAIGFLVARPGAGVQAASASIHAPDPAGFAAALSSAAGGGGGSAAGAGVSSAPSTGAPSAPSGSASSAPGPGASSASSAGSSPTPSPISAQGG
ncbi:MAG: hypothetical protein ACR2OB_08725 [Solirubrobacteraceae bacterium]